MSETRRMVVALLNSYPEKKTRLEQLRFELHQVNSRSEVDIIEELAIRGASLSGGGARRGYISNKTMELAFEYRDISRRMSSDAVSEIIREIGTAEAEVERIEKYVSFLDEAKSSIISEYYFKNNSWDKIAAQSGINKRTLQRQRDFALDELASMYSYMEGLDRKPVGRLEN